jgi:hypothetical protein
MTVNNVQESISLLDALNPSDPYAYEKALLAFLKIKKLPVLLNEIPKGTILFKSRTHKNDVLFTEINEISFPPEQVVVNFARCNRPFQSKLYCSENRITSFAELVEYWSEDTLPGDKLFVTIGRWILKNPIQAILVTTPDSQKRISQYDKIHGSILDSFLNKYQGEFKEANILLYRYLFEKFRKPAKNDRKTYIITSAYCNLSSAFAKGQSNGIHYPSVPFNGDGDNYCLEPEFINPKNIDLTHVIRNEFTVYLNEAGKHGFLETGIKEATFIDYNNNIINWQKK